MNRLARAAVSALCRAWACLRCTLRANAPRARRRGQLKSPPLHSRLAVIMHRAPKQAYRFQPAPRDSRAQRALPHAHGVVAGMADDARMTKAGGGMEEEFSPRPDEREEKSDEAKTFQELVDSLPAVRERPLSAHPCAPWRTG